MKRLLFILLLFCAFITRAQNLVLNGGFEQNTESQCYHSMNLFAWNSTVSNSTSYGNGETALLRGACITCAYFPNFYWGGGAQEGQWFGTVRSEAYYNQPGTIWGQSKLSLALSQPLSNETNYELSFYIKKPPYPIDDNLCSNVKNNFIAVGISNTDTTFGRLLVITALGDSNWTRYSTVFQTNDAEEHLTIEVAIGDTNNYVLFIDNFSIVPTSASAINEIPQHQKQLVKIVDILGKESKPIPNAILFYIYSDGTVEKKVIIE